MKSLLLALALLLSLTVFGGEKEGVGGDPLIEEFYHRSLFALNTLKNGLTSRKLANVFETAYKDLRVDITDRELLTTGRVLDDPKRPGKSYVLLDRNKFFKLLVSSPGGDITAFVAHEVFETKGLDFNYEITRSLRFSEDEYQRWRLGTAKSAAGVAKEKRTFDLLRQVDGLDSLWSNYKFHFIRQGRVVSLDEGEITTSEGQGYGMLRAVWSDDPTTFEKIWKWTREHLQVRADKVFAWKWKGTVIDKNNAADADTDIALALILAHRKFNEEKYLKEGIDILNSLWETSVIEIQGEPFLTAGNWAKQENPVTIHVGYLAPYAYEVFSKVDYRHPWKRLIETSYKVLHEIYDVQGLKLPPERIYLTKDGKFLATHPKHKKQEVFGYDNVPLFWRLAMDKRWNGRGENRLLEKALQFFVNEWDLREKFLERYEVQGSPLSNYENLPLYASVYALSYEMGSPLAEKLVSAKVSPLLVQAVEGKALPYYLHNWLWFSGALATNLLSPFDEFLGFLRPFDIQGFLDAFPLWLFLVMVVCYFLRNLHPFVLAGFMGSAIGLSVHYLWWRATETLNFIEPFGGFISVSLLLAEAYGFSTVLFLIVQVGIGKKPQRKTPNAPNFSPSVDIFVPVFNEPLEILERTILGCKNLNYDNKKIFVLDDGHRLEVETLCQMLSVQYILGPKKHAKAGNLNNALLRTQGELVLVLDTDHIPVHSFLSETVPYFVDTKVGFVQTPHHFYNEDIFQRTFRTHRGVPNEQDMFNHAIQGGRDAWGGTFFAGSGALFRRKALQGLGGFLTLSITEDIHTSQHLHSKGWKSVFVDKDLTVGLTAENFASHIIQRRRWMLGCLQIFFKDNALFCKGLPWRHRLGYFASHYYFLFPIFRVIFFVTPLYYLFFHLHPVFTDVSVLVAHLLPFMVALPLMTNVILPGWPRLLWGTAYEFAVCFSLFRAAFDLILPKSLGFKVTPKGILSHERQFDKASAALILLATLVVLGAIAKGLLEFYYFGIEKDAYFFNLTWATINLFFLAFALLLAWEKPQRRKEHRVRVKGSVEFETESGPLSLPLTDISLTGFGFGSSKKVQIPKEGIAALKIHESTIRVPYELVRLKSSFGNRIRGGVRFQSNSKLMENEILKNVFAHPKTWENSHEGRSRSQIRMGTHFLLGLFHSLRPYRVAKAVFILGFSFSFSAHGSLTESWYLSRGRSNQEIKNYKAAIEAYEKASKINPDNAETLKNLGLVYEAQGLRDKSIATFDRYLEKNPSDYSICFKQAQNLDWARYSYRQQDALRYYRQGLSQKNDSRMRLKYASILARKKSSVPEAIEQFELVLKDNPRNREAHTALAKAYAWNGNRDLAAYHADKASDAGAVEVRTLQSELNRGHEFKVVADVDSLYQPNSVYNIQGVSTALSAREDVGSFVTLNQRVGWEYYSGSDSSMNGVFFKAGGQYRLSEETHLNGNIGYHTLGDNGDVVFGANVWLKNGTQSINPGVEKSLVQDSYIAYAGKPTSRVWMGGARLYDVYTNFSWDLKPFYLSIRPTVGFVTSTYTPSNFRGGAMANASYQIIESAAWEVFINYRATVLHFGADHSATVYSTVEPYGDAYFSPRFYFDQTPFFTFKWLATEQQRVSLESGPSIQMIHAVNEENSVRIGILTHAKYEYLANKNFNFWMNFGFVQIASVYNRFNAGAGGSWVF